MGDCLKDCLTTDSKKTNIKQVVNKIMKEASIAPTEKINGTRLL